MSVPHLQTLELAPSQPAVASVIWMHGLGADASDFYPVPPQLGLRADLHVRYVFPNAPKIPVTINMGLIMPAWYDVKGFDAPGDDEERIRTSADWITELIVQEEERGIPANRIVLAGFSQGGAMALFTGLRHPERLAGVMCLSGYLPLGDRLPDEASAANRDVPVFQAHGTGDAVVRYEVARASRERLNAAGYEVEWHEYPMAHQVCGEELRDIGQWLGRVLTA